MILYRTSYYIQFFLSFLYAGVNSDCLYVTIFVNTYLQPIRHAKCVEKFMFICFLYAIFLPVIFRCCINKIEG